MAERSSELTKVDDLDDMPASGDLGLDGEYRDKDMELPAEDQTAEDTGHIKAQIVQTRSQMGETIDAIQERLSFANISEQVSDTVNSAIETTKEAAYDATIGKAVNFMKNVGDEVSNSGAFKVVKRNPLPFALIGVGAGLLAYQSYSGKNSRRGDGGAHGRGFYGAGSREGDYATTGSERRGTGQTSGTFDGISDKASSALGAVSDSAEAALDTVTGAVSNAYSGAGEMATKAYDRAGEYGTRAYDKYDEYLEENPLAVGAVALALGAAVGFSIPSTRYEGQLMGEARETLVQKAQDAAGSLVDKAKQVAAEAGETIKHETKALTQ